MLLLPALSLAGEDNPPGGIYGIWMGGGEKYDVRQDGAIFYWHNSAKPTNEGRFTIEKTWMDAEGKTSEQGGSMLAYLDEPDPELFFPDTYARL